MAACRGCLRIATSAPWYVGNKQVHDDLGVPFFADYIRSLTVRFDSKLTNVGNPLDPQRGRYLRLPRAEPSPLKQEYRVRQLVLATRKGGHFDTLNRPLLALFD
jgi:hypothetical protein